MACRILVPRPGIEPVPPAVEAGSLNHWTAREVQERPLNKNCMPIAIFTIFTIAMSFVWSRYFFLILTNEKTKTPVQES